MNTRQARLGCFLADFDWSISARLSRRGCELATAAALAGAAALGCESAEPQADPNPSASVTSSGAPAAVTSALGSGAASSAPGTAASQAPAASTLATTPLPTGSASVVVSASAQATTLPSVIASSTSGTDASSAGAGGAPSAGTASAQAGGAGLGQGGFGGSMGVGGSGGAAGEPGETCELGTQFEWTSSGILLSPSDSDHASIKDPTVVYHNGKWHVIATVFDRGIDTYNMVYTSFTDWSEASSAEQIYLGAGEINGYNCAPQLFFFEPQNKWYLIYQSDNNFPSFSTNDDLEQPLNWTAPQALYASEPQIVTQNKGQGFWIDFWVICDAAQCYLFFSDDNGNYYRAQTALDDFPNGFDTPVIILRDTRENLFEASNVYKLRGSDEYLLLIESMSNSRWFRAWTATSLDGEWTPLADTQNNPFAAISNVTFEGPAWSGQVSHGEMLRAGVDQTLTIDACNLQYLYQGLDGSVTQESVGGYNYLPYRLGLLTAVQ